jgi:hypothetical protein
MISPALRPGERKAAAMMGPGGIPAAVSGLGEAYKLLSGETVSVCRANFSTMAMLCWRWLGWGSGQWVGWRWALQFILLDSKMIV